MSFHKILCPIDFSPGSDQALRIAARLAKESSAELVIVHAWHIPPIAFGSEFTFPTDVIQQLIDDANAGLEQAKGRMRELGITHVSSKLLTGVPWNEIVELAASDGAFDLIVIGTHGRTGLARILLGSVAEKVVRHAPCPVLAVRLDSQPRELRHILCPTDFSESSHHAVRLAGELAQSTGASITLLHVLELPVAYSGEPHPPELYREIDVRSTELLQKWAAALRRESGAQVTTKVRLGWPGAETLAMLDEDSSYDLVVMGSHGRTGIKRALLGSVAEKTVRHARCPVLVARR
ncbi:MAG TPA: universal stress protein [Kofleriaceae bacterium]|nr:universal stress protein [Kofleriaceae bacterium]